MDNMYIIHLMFPPDSCDELMSSDLVSERRGTAEDWS